MISGAITHTPDGVYLSGPAPGPRNYWMHCGAAIGVAQGAGAGKYLAQWMVHGQAEINMREFDPRRFGDWADEAYTTTTAIADYHAMYYCYKPGEQHEVGRGLRKSSLYERLAGARRAVRADLRLGAAALVHRTDDRRALFVPAARTGGAGAAEASRCASASASWTCRRSPNTRCRAPDAFAFLQRICANKIPTKDGAHHARRTS